MNFGEMEQMCGSAAEKIVAKREADHKTDLQRIQESYSSGSQKTK